MTATTNPPDYSGLFLASVAGAPEPDGSRLPDGPFIHHDEDQYHVPIIDDEVPGDHEEPPPPIAAEGEVVDADFEEVQPRQPRAEHSGLNVDYYRVAIPHPKRTDPYIAECEDIIEALGMTFHEGNAFKAVWRRAAARTLGLRKLGNTPLYDAQKIAHAGSRLIAQDERTWGDV